MDINSEIKVEHFFGIDLDLTKDVCLKRLKRRGTELELRSINSVESFYNTNLNSF